MPCIWLRHNNSQLFVTLAIIPVNPGLLSQGVGVMLPEAPYLTTALVDTGATITCLSGSCANNAGLFPIGKIPIHGVGGLVNQNSYLFHVAFPIAMPPGLALPGSAAPAMGQQQVQIHILDRIIQGCEFHAPSNFEVLLGMDVISTGTLVVQGDGGFSFSF